LAVASVALLLGGAAAVLRFPPVLAAPEEQAASAPAQRGDESKAASQAGTGEAKPSAGNSPTCKREALGIGPPTRRVAGVVTGPDGLPVAAAEVSAFGLREPPGELPDGAQPMEHQAQTHLRNIYWTERNKVLGRARTDAAGRYSLEIPRIPKLYSVVAVAKGLGFRVVEFFDDGPDDSAGRYAEDLQICLPKLAPIRGRILLSTGAPAEGVLVFVRQISRRQSQGDAWEQELVFCQCHLNVMRGLSPEVVDKYRA
jgi:hypothetical protein